MSSEELNNLSNIEDYLISINKLNILRSAAYRNFSKWSVESKRLRTTGLME